MTIYLLQKRRQSAVIRRNKWWKGSFGMQPKTAYLKIGSTLPNSPQTRIKFSGVKIRKEKRVNSSNAVTL
jgi:hypothetical protein